MSFSIKQISFLSLLCGLTLQAHTPNDDEHLGHKDAHAMYQFIGNEAQTAFDIPQAKQTPIKILNPNSHLAASSFALTDGTTIYINYDKISAIPYGAARAFIFHETVHKYRRDPQNNHLLLRSVPTTIGAIGATAMYKILQSLQYKKRLWVGAYVGFCLSAYVGCKIFTYVQPHLIRFQENRADRLGMRATECELCLNQAAAVRKIDETLAGTKEYKNFLACGYLPHEEISAIANEYKGKLCTAHVVPQMRASDEKILQTYAESAQTVLAGRLTTE